MFLKEKNEILELLEVIDLFLDGKIDQLPEITYNQNISESEVFFKINLIYNKLAKEQNKLHDFFQNIDKSNTMMQNLKEMIKDEVEILKKDGSYENSETTNYTLLTNDLLKTQQEFKKLESLKALYH